MLFSSKDLPLGFYVKILIEMKKVAKWNKEIIYLKSHLAIYQNVNCFILVNLNEFYNHPFLHIIKITTEPLDTSHPFR